MVVIGGIGSVSGAVLGAVYVVGLPALFNDSAQARLLTSGVADWRERNEHLVKRLNFKKVDGVRIRWFRPGHRGNPRVRFPPENASVTSNQMYHMHVVH